MNSVQAATALSAIGWGVFSNCPASQFLASGFVRVVIVWKKPPIVFFIPVTLGQLLFADIAPEQP